MSKITNSSIQTSSPALSAAELVPSQVSDLDAKIAAAQAEAFQAKQTLGRELFNTRISNIEQEIAIINAIDGQACMGALGGGVTVAVAIALAAICPPILLGGVFGAGWSIKSLADKRILDEKREELQNRLFGEKLFMQQLPEHALNHDLREIFVAQHVAIVKAEKARLQAAAAVDCYSGPSYDISSYD